MKLDKQKQDAIIEHFNKTWKGERRCPLCQKNDWTIYSEVYEYRQFNGGGFNVGGNAIPVLLIQCDNCGNTVTMNAVKAGVITPEGQDVSEL